MSDSQFTAMIAPPFMKIDQLTFTRFLAAILIVVYHYGSKAFPFEGTVLSFLCKGETVGVSYFFMLSGFVMSVAYWQKSNVSAYFYYKSRFARIYPLYLVALLFFLLLQTSGWNKENILPIFLQVMAVQAWIPGQAMLLNTPGWSLSVEAFFYALFPLLLAYYKKCTLWQTVIMAVFIWVLSQVLFYGLRYSGYYQPFPSPSHDWLYYSPYFHLNEFILGNAAGIFFLAHQNRLKSVGTKWILFLLLSIIVMAFCADAVGFSLHNGLMAPLILPFIVLLAAHEGKFSQWMKHRWLVFLGEISFGIYILQKPVFELSWWMMAKIGFYHHSLSFYIFIALLILLAAGSYYGIEKPLRQRLLRH